jgi:tripartite-type tricarboxylate transporter receptor subunit TctC
VPPAGKHPKTDTWSARDHCVALVVKGHRMKFLRHQRWMRASIAGFIITALSTLFAHDSAWSQTRVIKLVTPYPSGGLNESMFRVIADQIGRQGGPTFVIEARPGAGTMIATEAVSRAAPDGNTVLIVGNSFVIHPNLRKLTYDPLTSFEPICYLWQSPLVFVVNSASPYHTLSELLAAARNKPGELTMAGSGPATGTHIGFEQFKRAANVDITYVTFAGGVPVTNALLGNHVASGLNDYGLIGEHLNSGKLRALAVAPRTRIETLPDVPTVEESGFPGYEADIWYGLVAPAKTPQEKIVQFIDWLKVALRDPAFRAKLATVGLYPVGTCGADFGAHIRKQYDEYGRIIREANIKAE